MRVDLKTDLKTTLAVLTLLSLVAGCGPTPVKREELGSELYRALCSNYAKCGMVTTEAACLEMWQPVASLVSTDSYSPLISAGKVKYDGVQARRCMDAYANQACGGMFASAVPECLGVFEGQVALGGSCSSVECIPSAWCSHSGTTSACGTCKGRVAAGGGATSVLECAVGLVWVGGLCIKPGVEGTACEGGGFFSSCEPALFCASDTKTCMKRRLVGESCNATTSVCGNFNACSNGVCTSPGAVGASCGASATLCKFDLTCDATANVCAQRPAEGATCRAGSECKFGLHCAAVQGTTALTCQKAAQAGQTCVSGGCATELFCESSSKTCKTLLAQGATCTQTESCKGGFCTAGACVNNIPTFAVCQ